MALKVCGFFLLLLILLLLNPEHKQIAMGFCTQSKTYLRHHKKDILSSSSRFRKRQHLVGAGKSPIAEQSNRSAEPQPSLKGQMRRETKMKAINRIKEHTGGKQQEGCRNRGKRREIYQEHEMCCYWFACWIGPIHTILGIENLNWKEFVLMNKKRHYAGRFTITWEWDQYLLVKIKSQKKRRRVCE